MDCCATQMQHFIMTPFSFPGHSGGDSQLAVGPNVAETLAVTTLLAVKH